MGTEVIGVGTDLVEVRELRVPIEERGARFRRVFTDAERADAQRYRDPVPHLAGRVAIKEAVMKALGHGLGAVSFTDIEVVRAESGRPSVELSGRAAALAAEAGVTGWHVSMTHTDSLAHAVAIAVGAPPS